jgi:hypothetical protein
MGPGVETQLDECGILLRDADNHQLDVIEKILVGVAGDVHFPRKDCIVRRLSKGPGLLEISASDDDPTRNCLRQLQTDVPTDLSIPPNHEDVFFMIYPDIRYGDT